MGPIIPALIGAGLQVATNVANAREARANRDWQERMSSTAHQREVRDLRAAGINPMIRNMSGASTPSGDRAEFKSPGEGIASALAVQRQRAEIRLIEAQTRREASTASLADTQAGDIATTAPGRLNLMKLQAEVHAMDVDQKRKLLPSVLAKAKEEVKLTASSARAAKAGALLDEMAAAGAANQEAFERSVGELGPWGKLFFNLLREARKPAPRGR